MACDARVERKFERVSTFVTSLCNNLTGFLNNNMSSKFNFIVSAQLEIPNDFLKLKSSRFYSGRRQCRIGHGQIKLVTCVFAVKHYLTAMKWHKGCIDFPKGFSLSSYRRTNASQQAVELF